MRAHPARPAPPRILIDNAAAGHLTEDLASMTVHVVDGRASAEIDVVGAPLHPPLPRVDVATTMLAIWLSSAEEAFSGRLTEIEIRMSAGAAPSTVLYAAGTAPNGASNPTVPLQFGAEIESGSVRRHGDGSTARCVAVAGGLCCGSRVSLTTPDPEFDGQFEVAELWHRFDPVHGLRVEFVAMA